MRLEYDRSADTTSARLLRTFKKDTPVHIELVDVVKQFGQLRVVDKVNLKIGDGEFFTLLGPSGCGKTTLLRMIAGFNDPDSGDIRFDGTSILNAPAHLRNTGMVFQNYALFPHMTVFDNVAYGMAARRLPHTTIRSRVEEILEAVQLLNLRDRYPRQLSGGQQQRVARPPPWSSAPTCCSWTSPCPTWTPNCA